MERTEIKFSIEDFRTSLQKPRAIWKKFENWGNFEDTIAKNKWKFLNISKN